MGKKLRKQTQKPAEKSLRAERRGQLISAPKLNAEILALIAEYHAHHPLSKKGVR